MTAVAGLTLELGLDSKLAREIVELVRDTAFGEATLGAANFPKGGSECFPAGTAVHKLL
jgi:hypothetical protein